MVYPKAFEILHEIANHEDLYSTLGQLEPHFPTTPLNIDTNLKQATCYYLEDSFKHSFAQCCVGLPCLHTLVPTGPPISTASSNVQNRFMIHGGRPRLLYCKFSRNHV